ncbi:MAG: hypothetical protein ACR2P0_14350 [Acidimicrobiales bacterium]
MTTQRRISEPQVAAETVARLATSLERERVRWCHWKSNLAIARSESAENDLDLLVDVADRDRFRAVLRDLGFVRVEKHAPPRPPAKEDWFFHDPGTRRVVHVDAHYELYVGPDRSKNVRLPLEDAFLDSARSCGLLKVPSPVLEYIVLVLRLVLKYGIWDEVVWQGLLRRPVEPKRSELAEFDHLRALVTPSQIDEALVAHLPWLDRDLFDQCVRLVADGAATGHRLRVGRQLYRSLSTHDSLRRRPAGLVRLSRRLALAAAGRRGGYPAYRISGGGVIVGVMGGDGSGKSTALDGVESWLDGMLDTKRIHLGKPPWSRTTIAVRGSLKSLVWIRSRFRPAPSRREFLEPTNSLRSTLWLACTARDRLLLFRRARRFADRGGVVLSDRYPHRALSSMEVPQIRRLAMGPDLGPVVERLARFEERCHGRIGPADALVVLRVDPETAVHRKTDEPSDYVRRRATEIWDVDWTSTDVQPIDATQLPDSVVSELETVVWGALS